MRICLHTNLQITKNYIGGTERFLISYAKELAYLGYDPFIVCSSLIPQTKIEGINIYGIIPDKYRSLVNNYSSLATKFISSEILIRK